MPIVKGKHYAYTKKGKEAARKARGNPSPDTLDQMVKKMKKKRKK